MTITCLHCGAETTNGLALCELCQRKARADLEFITIYFANLCRWRPGPSGVRSVPSSRQPSSFSTVATDKVSVALDEAGAKLAGWILLLGEDRGLDIEQLDDEGTMVQRACEMLTECLTSISTCEWAGDFVTETGVIEDELRRLTEQVAPGWYAGACRRCEHPTHVIPGFTWVTCGGCGATTYARDHLEQVLTEARGWVARPMRLADAVVALIDTELSIQRLHKRISKWGERGQIEAHRLHDDEGDPVGPKRFQLGEVLDRLRAEGATRLDSGMSDERMGA